MKHQILAWILALLFVFSIHTVTVAGHSTDNGTCTDDIIHWQNMIEKRSDAPLYEQSKIVQAQAVGKLVEGVIVGSKLINIAGDSANPAEACGQFVADMVSALKQDS